MVVKKKIGLIIGSGELASYCIEQLVLLGYEITIIRLPCIKVKIKKNLDHIDLKYEELNETFSLLKQRQINDIALIGYMERPEIDPSKVTYGSQILLANIFSILNKGDGEIFTAVKQMFVNQNFTLIKVQDLLPELTLESGIYGSSSVGKKVLKEIEAGVKAFLNYARLDIGQSLIFQHGHCLGLETITGTDEMLRAIINFRKKNNKRSKEILSGGILIKGSKPDQVLDIDTPVIGPDTIKLAKNAKLNGLVIESNKVILVNRNLIIDTLQSYKMFLVSIKFFG
jgi:DUF1009 family protein